MSQLFVRPLHPGLGNAVAERTILRKTATGAWEGWGDVAHRVALGNTNLWGTPAARQREYEVMRAHIAKGVLLLSGRHLQHGDADQPTRNQEIFTNCSTAATSFVLFDLLLNGSGVGRCYDDDLMVVDWSLAPTIVCVLSASHPDFEPGMTTPEQARMQYGDRDDVHWHAVGDTREGWAQAVEVWETMAAAHTHAGHMLILDFSLVRPKGSPIHGMQDRPASGPVTLMQAFAKADAARSISMPWLQTMMIDHALAECVLVGGARRAARIAAKHWADPTILDFISIKRPGTTVEVMWSSNNSVCVDDEFWTLARLPRTAKLYDSERAAHARAVLRAIKEASYGDGTGEPGVLNVHRLTNNDEGWEEAMTGPFVGSAKYQLSDAAHALYRELAERVKVKSYHMIVNPCGEIPISLLGGYCVLADVVPFHADSLDEAEDAVRVAVRALMRVNLMDSLYAKEVRRTNRIGISLTGVHEFAWKFFRLAFRDLLDEVKAKDFWLTLARFNRAARAEAIRYAAELGVAVPHTVTAIKPAGTTSKLFGLTEGWHLPSVKWYLRWVQFRSDGPQVAEHAAQGYPTRVLTSYPNTTIVGFPTQPVLAGMDLGDKLVVAAEATPEEQYRWLMLGEKYWIDGTDENGVPVNETYGGQVSYTLKYDPKKVDYDQFSEMFDTYQSQIKCCTVMPQEDTSSYEYLPEQPIDEETFMHYIKLVTPSAAEAVDFEHVDCASGACPVDFREV